MTEPLIESESESAPDTTGAASAAAISAGADTTDLAAANTADAAHPVNNVISLNGQPLAMPAEAGDPQNTTLLQRYAEQANFHLRLPNYEGPLDVLLRLIEENQLEITAVSLALVADQFIAYMTHMPNRDPRSISGFVAVAAKLILLKSRALLPQVQMTPEEEEEVDDLLAQLKAYQIFKNAAKVLKMRQELGLRSYPAQPPNIARPQGKKLPLDNVSLDLLAKVMQRLVAKWTPPPEASLVVKRQPFSVQECMAKIEIALATEDRIKFTDVLEGVDTRVEVVVTLLALLELLKRYVVRVYQESAFGDIVIESFPLEERPKLEEEGENSVVSSQ